MLICPTVYEMLNDNVTLYTMTESVPSLVCNGDIKNENDPRMDEEVDGRQSLNSGKDKGGDHDS